jgi:hypothetical protein
VCGSFPRGCGSQGVSKPTKRGQPTCPTGKSICGVPDDGTSVDCVDANNDAESCKRFRFRYLHYDTEGRALGGGCTIAPPLAFGNNVANGKNCKALPNVENVICRQGTCEVLSCKAGFEVSDARDSCVKAGPNRFRKARGVEVVDQAFDLLISHNLLVSGFDVATSKAEIIAAGSILNYDNILQALLLQHAVVGVTNLQPLKAKLGLAVPAPRRDTVAYAVDYVLGLCLERNLIVGFTDLPSLKNFLGPQVETLETNSLLETLVIRGLVVKVTNISALRQLLGC